MLGSKTLRRLALLAALTVGAGFTTASTARADGLEYLGQASAQVMASARSVSNISDYGYLSGTSFMAGNIQTGGECTFRLQLQACESYLFLAGGDDDTRELSVEVRNDAGQLITSSRASDASPSLQFTPDTSGWYVLHLVLHRSDTATSFAALALLQRHGMDVPVHNLAEAMGSLQAYCARIEKVAEENGHTMSLQSKTNEWAVFGAILKSGGEAEIDHVNPGAGGRCIVAAGDNNAADVDLTIAEDAADGAPDGQVLGVDHAPDANAAVALQTGVNSACRIHTIMSHSDGDRYSLVLTGVLTVN